MNYKGILIEESLANPNILDDFKILATKIYPVTSSHKTPWLTQWTLHTVEVPEKDAERLAEKLTTSFDKQHPHSWYADYKNERYHFIIFQNKVFKVELAKPTLYKEVKEYGLSIGIPQHQLDF
ncbi:MAG: hypothetical protein ACOCXT_04070 [Candidatus Dojkabacteria bacterium]